MTSITAGMSMGGGEAAKRATSTSRITAEQVAFGRALLQQFDHVRNGISVESVAKSERAGKLLPSRNPPEFEALVAKMNMRPHELLAKSIASERRMLEARESFIEAGYKVIAMQEQRLTNDRRYVAETERLLGTSGGRYDSHLRDVIARTESTIVATERSLMLSRSQLVKEQAEFGEHEAEALARIKIYEDRLNWLTDIQA
jgi:hypothetical protein